MMDAKRLLAAGALLSLMVLAAGCEIPFRMPSAKVKCPGLQVETGYSEGLAVVKRSTDFRHGYMSADGEIVIAPRFAEAEPFSEGLAAVQEDFGAGFGYIERHGRFVIQPQFDGALPFSEGFAAVRHGDKWGFVDRSGVERIPPQFDDAFGFSAGRARVVVDGLMGYVDKLGAWVVPPTFFDAGDFKEGLAFVCDRSLCGYIDVTGKELNGRSFDDAESFSEGRAAVRRGEKWGFIDKSGRFVVEPRFDEVLGFSEGLARVGVVKESSFDAKFGGYTGQATFHGFIDREGNEVIGEKILGATSFTDGISIIRVPAGGLCSDCYQYRLMTREGKFLPGRYDLASPYSEERAVVTKGNASYVLDKAGRPLVEIERSYPTDRSESLHRIGNVRFGFIDASGRVVMPHSLSSAQPFSEGLAFVEGPRQGKSFARRFVDKTGNMVVELPPAVGQALPFTDGLSLVSRTEGGSLVYGFMDRAGELTVAPQFADAASFSEGLAAVKLSRDSSANDWGFIDTAGTFIIPPGFKSAGSFTNGLAYVEWVSKERYLLSAIIDKRGAHVVEKPFLPELSRALFGTPSLAQFQARARYRFGERLIPRVEGGIHGYVDMTGRPAIRDSRLIFMNLFSEGRAAVMVRDKSLYQGRWGFIDTSGAHVVPARFTEVESFSEGLAMVRDVAGRIGYVDQSGSFAIAPAWFDEAHPFHSGLARVNLNGRYGYIDKTGAFAIPPRFVRAEDFSEGLASTAIANPEPQKRRSTSR